MESIQNISIYIPDVPSSLNKKDLMVILQEKCHLGAVKYIEILENLCVNLENPNETNCTAFVYFQYWYSTLGNAMIQEQLEKGESITIPSYLNTVLNMCAYKNNFSIPMSYLEELEEEEQSERDEKNGFISEEKRQEENGDKLWEEEIEEELSRIMGEESFDLVDVEYVTCLEKQLRCLLSSISPITPQ
jgi:hypothetical protein